MKSYTYLDHAATTPLRPEVLAALEPVLRTHYGNPSSIHALGRQARGLIEEARDRVAGALGARRGEVFFTSGGTEANNLGVLGAYRAGTGQSRVVVSAVEHKAVLGAARRASVEGAELVVLGVDGNGTVDLAALDHALPARVVSIMWGNNEVGTVQPVAEIAQRCRRAGALYHTDAVQAFGRVPVRVDALECDLLTISGHKVGAPKGIGALFVRAGTELVALTHGGGQERDLRPGTENVLGAVALGAAATLAVAEQAAEAARLGALRDLLEQRLLATLPDCTVNAGPAERLPHISNLSFQGVELETLLISLDLEGLATSSGSACQSGGVAPSHVLAAMNRVRPGEASIRVSLGRATASDDIDAALAIVIRVVSRLRQRVLA